MAFIAPLLFIIVINNNYLKVATSSASTEREDLLGLLSGTLADRDDVILEEDGGWEEEENGGWEEEEKGRWEEEEDEEGRWDGGAGVSSGFESVSNNQLIKGN